jgi:hypothetical protein
MTSWWRSFYCCGGSAAFACRLYAHSSNWPSLGKQFLVNCAIIIITIICVIPLFQWLLTQGILIKIVI